MAKKLYYKIGEACKQLDIQPYVLRYWETEFPALAPSKSKSGQRVYSRQDLEIIRRIKELLYDEGYTISGAKKKLEGELESGGPRPSAPKAAAGESAAAKTEKDKPASDPPAAKTAKDKAAAEKPEADGSSAGKAAPAAQKAEAGKPGAPAAEEPSKPLAEKTVPAARPAASGPGQTGRLDTLEKDVKMLREGVQEALKQAKALLNMLDASSDRS